MSELKFKRYNIDFVPDCTMALKPAIILKLTGCNVKCIKDNKICMDSYNTNDINEKTVIDFVQAHDHIKHIVITGGEPLLFKKELENFLTKIYKDDYHITIFTNGTLPVLNPLIAKFKISRYIVNLSNRIYPEPGFSHIDPIKNKKFVFGSNDVENMPLFNVDAIRDICICANEYFIYVQRNSKEIEQFIENLINNVLNTGQEFYDNFLKKYPVKPHIVCVPINDTDEEKNAIKEICIKNQYLYSETIFN